MTTPGDRAAGRATGRVEGVAEGHDPVCATCDEPRSAHVPTAGGPLTCPREARGEGTYVLVRPGYTMSGAMGGSPGADDLEVPPLYRFEPVGPKKEVGGDELRALADDGEGRRRDPSSETSSIGHVASSTSDRGRFPRPVVCAWCGNRHRAVAGNAVQGDGCAASVFERDGAWFLLGHYGSSYDDVLWRWTVDPPGGAADVVCDNCVGERVCAGDLERVGEDVVARLLVEALAEGAATTGWTIRDVAAESALAPASTGEDRGREGSEAMGHEPLVVRTVFGGAGGHRRISGCACRSGEVRDAATWVAHVGVPGAERFVSALLALEDAAQDAVDRPGRQTLARLARVTGGTLPR